MPDTDDPPATVTFTLTFNSQGGTELAPQTIASGKKSEKPADPTKANFVFAGWYKEQTLTTLFNFTQETITGNLTLYAKWEKFTLNTSMAWLSMREGLVQLDNGTQGIKTIGVVVSKDATAPSYAGVKDLPGFYTRTTKADGTPRTAYLSMTDKMTSAKFNANVTVSVDGGSTGFVSAIAAAPELLHPNTNYYAHFYEITGTAGAAIEKLAFTTEDFPAAYPTSRGRYSRFYDKITAGSTSPAIEYKASESHLIPFRYHYLVTGGGPYAFTISSSTFEFAESSPLMRPFGNGIPGDLFLFYDLYNIAAAGPATSVALWDGMIKPNNITNIIRLSHSLGREPSSITILENLLLVTE
ncbi:InlB B-repeat-containing protein [Candidatus Haliotispira prima]|uniref:InlB B-repeat-containing protein n=1 Tax=Candidatus Haliotispira prima TaxID=3034016 RepID=A0ABY8MFJ3_9SPIO|nr:InlB B-repeat-containing protein [Candidatus Haliotispira prima]